MKSLIEIVQATSLTSTDADYLSKQFIAPDLGGGRRGKKQLWGNQKVVEFAVSKRLLNYGIQVFRIREVVETLRTNRKWRALFDDTGNLSDSGERHIEKGGHYYLHLKSDSRGVVKGFIRSEKRGAQWEMAGADALIIDITGILQLAVEDEPT